jgi:hypothetical protein
MSVWDAFRFWNRKNENGIWLLFTSFRFVSLPIFFFKKAIKEGLILSL